MTQSIPPETSGATQAERPLSRSHTQDQVHDPLYRELAASDDFQELRRRYRAFVFPWTIAFLVWYLLFVALSNWAPDFMGSKVLGNINVGLVMGLLQFLTTFGLAFLYSRHAARSFDPLADSINRQYDDRRRGEDR